MAYSAAADLYSQCGEDNVRDWANMDRKNNQTTIDARITWAITRADEEIDERMKANGRYSRPLIDGTGNTPISITIISAALACGHLYEANGVEDYQPNEEGRLTHSLSAMLASARRDLNDIATGERWLDAV
jgi:hypothetical protein